MPELQFHHIGIPTDKDLPEEDYIPKFKVAASGYKESEYGIEWLKFDDDCPTSELIKTVPHVAFVVKDIQKAIKGKNVIAEPSSTTDGITVAFIEENGAPVEFIEFENPECEIWPHNAKFRIE